MKQEIIKQGIKGHYFNLVKKSNFENCLVVSSKGNFKRNYEKTFIDGLNDQINIFHHAINEYPNFSNINHLYSVFENKNINLVIAIGGGSAIDLGKVFSTFFLNKKLEAITDLKIRKNKIFNISVPTTAGSGAESTKFATIWSQSDSTKYSIEDDCLLPNVAYLDSSYSISLPLISTLTTSLDALCHCLDCLWNKTKNNDAENYSRDSINIITEYLPKVVNNLKDPESRKFLLEASNKAGQAINITKTSLNHSISYPLTNFYNLPHGFACAFSVPGIIEFYQDELAHSKQSQLFEKANNLILDLELKEVYQKYLEFLDIEKVASKVLSNSRSKNFGYNIDNQILKNILSISKKLFLD